MMKLNIVRDDKVELKEKELLYDDVSDLPVVGQMLHLEDGPFIVNQIREVKPNIWETVVCVAEVSGVS